MKRILIMIMSCNEEFFIKQEQVLRETYLSILPDNMDYIIYRGGYNEQRFNDEEDVLELTSKDDLEHTYHKTFEAIAWANENVMFDYIFRTNTSTYINIDLLNAFVQSLNNDSILWGGELTNNRLEDSMFWGLYLRGNALLISKNLVMQLFIYGSCFMYLNCPLIDDAIIGAAFNNMLNIKQMETSEPLLLTNFFKSFRQGWYKTVLNNYCYHQVCGMNNTNKEFDFIKTMINIQIRNWYDRSLEEKHFKEIHEVFIKNKDNDIEKTVQMQYEYSQNPDVFLGSEFGFIPLSKLM